MRTTLREYQSTPKEQATKSGKSINVARSLAKLSGIPHVYKLMVDNDDLLDLMVGLQINVEAEKRYNEEKVVLYDPHYFSGLVELPSPKPSEEEVTSPRWPLISHKGRRKHRVAIMDKVPEEPDLDSVRTDTGDVAQDIVSTELLYQAPEIDGESLSPKQLSSTKSIGLRAQCDLQELGQCPVIVDLFPAVPDSEQAVPSAAYDYPLSSRVTSKSTVSLMGPVREIDRRRAQSESSVYSYASKSSCYMHSPWVEEIETSFGLRDINVPKSSFSARGPLDAQFIEFFGRPATWDQSLEASRNQSLSSQKTSLGRYRTTRLPSASL